MIRPVDFTFGGSDVVRVRDGGAGVDELNLHKKGNMDIDTHGLGQEGKPGFTVLYDWPHRKQ